MHVLQMRAFRSPLRATRCAMCVVAVMFSAALSAQVSETTCGPLATGGFGPFDYRTSRDKHRTVESFHFTPEVESLIRGKSSTNIGEDIQYTLNVFPNHHRALIAMMRLGEKLKTNAAPPGARYPIECYFERALRFRPDDPVARMIYATYLVTNKREDEASVQLQKTAVQAEDNPFTHYNIGLIYFDMKDFDKALEQAHKAIALGFGQAVLRDKLQAAGKWVEPYKTSGVPEGAPPAGK